MKTTEEKSDNKQNKNQIPEGQLPATKETSDLYNLPYKTLSDLIIPGPENNYSPPVGSTEVTIPGANAKLRYFSYESLLEYLNKLATDACQEN